MGSACSLIGLHRLLAEIMRLPTTTAARTLQTGGLSLLLASQCLLGVAPPGCAETATLPPPPAAVQQQNAEVAAISLEQARQLGALIEMKALPDAEASALKKSSLTNSQLMDKGALKVLKSGQDYAARGADPETQTLDMQVLRQAEGRFSLLIDELAPSFAGGYANRANVRVAMKDYAGAADDYAMALRLAPVSEDAWVNWLNRGSTLVALGQPAQALPDMQRAVELSKAAQAAGANQAEKLTLLGRGSALHALGRWEAAAADYGAVVNKEPGDVQPYWLRYGLELFELGRTQEALGIVRRVAAKFSVEPECQLALYTATSAAGGERGAAEALRLWSVTPKDVREAASTFDYAKRQWPPSATDAAKAFLSGVAAADATPTAAATAATPAA